MADTRRDANTKKVPNLHDTAGNLPDTSEADAGPISKDPNHTSPSEEAEQHPDDTTERRLLRLIPLETLAFYWVASASTVAVIHTLYQTVPRPALIAPCLFTTLALSLVTDTLSHRPTHPRWSVQLSPLFTIGLTMLTSTEMVWVLRMMDV